MIIDLSETEESIAIFSTKHGESFNLKKAQEATARKALAETEALELTNLGKKRL